MEHEQSRIHVKSDNEARVQVSNLIHKYPFPLDPCRSKDFKKPSKDAKGHWKQKSLTEDEIKFLIDLGRKKCSFPSTAPKEGRPTFRQDHCSEDLIKLASAVYKLKSKKKRAREIKDQNSEKSRARFRQM